MKQYYTIKNPFFEPVRKILTAWYRLRYKNLIGKKVRLEDTEYEVMDVYAGIYYHDGWLIFIASLKSNYGIDCRPGLQVLTNLKRWG